MTFRPRISAPRPVISFAPPTPWQRFRRDPASFLAQWLYKRQSDSQNERLQEHSSEPNVTTVVCISDTHCTQPNVPNGDILLHAGDLTNTGSFSELQEQLDWLNTLPHKHKIVIAGNHDRLLDTVYVARFPDRISEGEGTSRSDLRWGSIIYLLNTSTRLTLDTGRVLSIYGSPWTPEFGTFAFQYPPIRKVWPNIIPDDTDIVVTHGPPRGHLDLQGKGCPQLLNELRRVRPRLVVFGHIHAACGQEALTYDGIGYAYDAIMGGEGGLGCVIVMAILIIWKWMVSVVFGAGTLMKPRSATVLVNAAVVGGQNNKEQHNAVIQRI